MKFLRPASVVSLAGLSVLALSGCVANEPSGGAALEVKSSQSACEVSTNTATSGTVAFEVSNTGTQITEFYLLGEDGLRIVGEVENIAPGTSRTLTVLAQPGQYFTLCKPGMIGEGVGRTGFTVTGEKVELTGDDAEQKQHAVELYAAFVKDQVEKLVPEVDAFVAAYTAGEDEVARTKFPLVRSYYERIEPVAESLGDLDPRIDYREVDAVAEGLAWTGFHRIEKDLWVPASDALNADGETPAWQDWAPSTSQERAAYGAQLVADIAELNEYVHSEEFTQALADGGIGSISNGAIGLLDEVATGKISGDEDWWSGTDLYDFQANVEGSKNAFEIVRDFAATKDAKLVEQIDAGYADLLEALAQHGSLETSFIHYGELSDANKRELSDLLNALAEPLSQLTATVLA